MTTAPVRPALMSDHIRDAVTDVTDTRRGGEGSFLAHALVSVEAFAKRFVAFPSDHAAVAFVLWAAHTHALDAFESTPRLALLSPEPGSGKTRAQEVLELLVPRPMFSLNSSAAALFRTVASDEGRPTVLMDEADTVFGPRASKDHEDLRGFVNAGHRRGAVAHRCVVRGKTIDVEAFPAYAAVCLAGLDDLPDTIMARSVVVRMRRRAPQETVEAFRHRIHGPEGHQLRDRLEREVDAVAPRLAQSWPEMPDGVEDRAADVWEPLLAVADAAGGEWPARARCAAVTFVTDTRGGGQTLGVRLLSDLRDAFRTTSTDKAFTTELLEYLNGLDEAPWGDLRGKPLDARGLSRRLAKYGVAPRSVRIGEHTAKGYVAGDLADAFDRYLSPPSPESVTSVTPSHEDLPVEDPPGLWGDWQQEVAP